MRVYYAAGLYHFHVRRALTSKPLFMRMGSCLNSSICLSIDSAVVRMGHM